MAPLLQSVGFPSSTNFGPLRENKRKWNRHFTFSPFGLGCRLCKNNVTIHMDKRSIQLQLKKHGMDSRVSTVRSLLKGYKTLLQNAKALQTIDPFQRDFNEYIGYSWGIIDNIDNG
jgi:hypothetical protein